MAVAYAGKEMAGYASVTLSADHQPKISTVFREGFATEASKRLLLQHAKNLLPTMPQGTALQNNIGRFADWLRRTA